MTKTSPADRPLVTFTVKAYRQEHIVRHAIEGAFAQTYEPLEIILSDDCSPDGTFAVMEEMAAAYDGPHKVRLNRNPTNLGIARHTRRIWELASGRLLMGSAGDDVSVPDRVERIVEAWEAGRGNVMAVHSRVMRIDAQGAELTERAPQRTIIDDPSPLNLARTGFNCIGATAAWDRRIAERLGPLSEDCVIEDGPLFFRAALLGAIAYIDEPLVRYRVGGISERKPVSPGYDYLYGDRMRMAHWNLTNALSFLHDMEKVDFPEKEACREICRERIDRLAFEVELWRASPAGRLALLPAALRRSAETQSGKAVRDALKHLLGPLYVRYYNSRYARRAG